MDQVEIREDVRYGYAVARVRALEARMPDEYFFARLATESPQGALRLLVDSAYRAEFADEEGLENFPRSLERHLAWVLGELEEMAVEPEIIRILRMRYDYHNFVPCFRAVQHKAPLDEAQVSILGNLSVDALASAVGRQDETFFRDFYGYLWAESIEIWEDWNSARREERLISLWDNAYWDRVDVEAEEIGNEFLMKYFDCRMRWENLERLVRQKILYREDQPSVRMDLLLDDDWGDDLWKRLGLTPADQLADALPLGILKRPFGEAVADVLASERMDAFLKARTAWLDDFIEPSKYVVHGPEPLIAFYLRKEAEVDRLRALLVKVLYPVAEEIVEEASA